MFLLQSIDHGQVPPFMYIPCGNIVPKAGMALTLSGGALATATGTQKPEYISLLESKENLSGHTIPVMRVTDEALYGVTANADISALSLGDTVTISTDGLQVTAVTGGAAKIIATEGTSAGSMVTVQFA